MPPDPRQKYYYVSLSYSLVIFNSLTARGLILILFLTKIMANQFYSLYLCNPVTNTI